ncbi:MAG: FG-GAP repeat protein [Sandaracinaceae bacterium]|nr:FG-GAP repeat protein [Sandaracinaceae bacterium]
MVGLLPGCSLINPTAEFADPDASTPHDSAIALDAGLDSGDLDAATDASIEIDAGVAPTAPELRFPWNGYATGSVHTRSLPAERNAARPTFRWEPVDDALRYEIELTDECNAETRSTCAFLSSDVVRATVDGASYQPEAPLAVSITPPVGRRYFWRVRACSGLCSSWSEVRYLDVARLVEDVDGDGYGDLVVTDPAGRNVTAGIDGAGLVFIYVGGPAGSDLTHTYVLESPMARSGARFGEAVALGDINADGFADVFVGEPATTAGGGYLFLGGAAGPSSPLRIESPSALPGSNFGDAAAIGDLDADGFADLSVGASRERAGSVVNAGRVHVLHGRRDGLGSSAVTLASSGATDQGGFGLALGLGDFDGDGLIDLAVGAPGEFGDTLRGAGQVHVFGGDARRSYELAQTVVSALPDAGGQFGRVLHSGRDSSGDGFADLLIGAPREAAGSTARAGAAHLLLGSSGGVGLIPATVLRGTVASELLASQVALGDVDGDGQPDLVATSPNANVGGVTDAGAITILGRVSSGTFEPLGQLRAPVPTANDRFGTAMALSDVNGDGYADIGVANGGSARAVFVVLGSSDPTTSTVLRLDRPAGTTSSFGNAIR